jgi:hypothetical protein
MNQLTCSQNYDRENERIKKVGHDEYAEVLKVDIAIAASSSLEDELSLQTASSYREKRHGN